MTAVQLSLVVKRPDISAELFRRRWLVEVGPLASIVPGLLSHVQNHVRERIDQQLRPAVAVEPAGVSLITFQDAEGLESACRSWQYRDYKLALASIASSSIALSVSRNELTPPPPLPAEPGPRIGASGKPLVKRIVILRRARHMSRDAYRKEWWSVHAVMVRALPGVEGYYANHVESEAMELGSAEAGSMPCLDSVVELWFGDVEAMRRGLPPEGSVQAHAKSIHSNMSISLVDEIRLL